MTTEATDYLKLLLAVRVVENHYHRLSVWAAYVAAHSGAQSKPPSNRINIIVIITSKDTGSGGDTTAESTAAIMISHLRCFAICAVDTKPVRTSTSTNQGISITSQMPLLTW